MSQIKRTPNRQIMAVIGILQDHILAHDGDSTKADLWGVMAMEVTSLELAVDLLIDIVDEVPDGTTLEGGAA